MSTSGPGDATDEQESHDVPSSGSGAQTALHAMLKRRQMRATRDPDPAPPDEDNNNKVPGG